MIFEVQNGCLFTGGIRWYISLLKVALWRVFNLHILQCPIVTCGFIFGKSYCALSIIPRVIDSTTILAKLAQ